MRRQRITTAAGVLIGAGVLSHILAFFREVIIANQFGATTSLDTFLLALIPISLFVMMSDSMMTSFVPLFTRDLTVKGEGAAWQTASDVITVFIALFAVLAFVWLIFAGPIMKAIGSGCESGVITQVLELLKVMFPILMVVLPIALTTAVLHSYRHFTYPAFAELLPNIGMILAVIFFSSRMGVFSLAAGMMGGYIARFLVQFAVIAGTLKRYYRFSFNIYNPVIKKFGVFTMLTVIANGSFVIYLVVDRYFASFLPVGTIAALNFADRLVVASYYIVICAIGSAVFPVLAAKAASDDKTEFRSMLESALRIGLTCVMPISVFLIIWNRPIVRLIFERGLFNVEATTLTAESLLFYAIGIFAFSGGTILIRGWYALHDFRIPALTGAVSLTVNVIGDYLLIGPLAHKGLALATAVASIVNFCLMLILLRRKIGLFNTSGFMVFFVKLVFISALTGLSGWLCGRVLIDRLDMQLFGDQLFFFCSEIIIVTTGFLCAGLLVRLQEIVICKQALCERLYGIRRVPQADIAHDIQ
ncbi:MAG: murein biosynthesis integral membrane protein MurJ [Candidatus Omnitrophica bacterium]|nr:murein biosynthesis integral membrane protein MurJ [Candidatus Omnitrophota bacterium]